MSLGPHENAADGRRSFQRYWIVGIAGIEQRHRTKLRPLLPEPQQFLTSQLDGNGYRPDLTFPILNGAPTEPELFPRDRLRISQFLPPLLEAPQVHRVILEPQQRKMTLAGQANASGAYFGVSNHDFGGNRLPVTRSRGREAGWARVHYQRSSRGPNAAPAKVHSTIVPAYQTA